MPTEISVLKPAAAQQIVLDAQAERQGAETARDQAQGHASDASQDAAQTALDVIAAGQARDLAETYADIDHRAATLAGLPDPTGLTLGETGLVLGSGDDEEDGLYEVQDDTGNVWVRIGSTGLAGKLDRTALPILLANSPSDQGEWVDLGTRLTAADGRELVALERFDITSYFDDAPGALFDLTTPENMRQELNGTGAVGPGDPVRWIQDPISGQVAVLAAGDPRTFELDSRGIGYLSDGDGIYVSTATINLSGSTAATMVWGLEYDNAPGEGASVPGDFDASSAGSSGSLRWQAPSGSSQFWFTTRGTVGSNETIQASPLGLGAPNVACLVGVVDYPSQAQTLRVNGVQVAQSVGGVNASANVGNRSLSIGGRVGLDFPFAGRLRYMAIVGEEVSGAELEILERRVMYLCDVAQGNVTPGPVQEWQDTDNFIVVWGVGQSNLAGRGETLSAFDIPDARSYKYDGSTDTLVTLADPTGTDSTALSGGGQSSVGPAMAHAVLSATNGRVGVIFVNTAIGGTSITTWQSGEPSWTAAVSKFTTAKAQIDALKLNVIGCIGVMIQGESDRLMDPSTYKGLVLDLLAEMRAETGMPDFKLVLSQIGLNTTGSDAAGWAAIRSAQSELARENAEIIMAHTGAKYFDERGLMVDTLHYNTAGLDEIGGALGVAVAAYGIGATPAGLSE